MSYRTVRHLKITLASGLALAWSPLASAVEMKIEVEARVFEIRAPIDGRVGSIDNVNGTGASVELDDIIRGVLVYESTTPDTLTSIGDPFAGSTEDLATYFYLQLAGGPNAVVEASFFAADGTLLMSTNDTAPNLTQIDVSDSYSSGLVDRVGLSVQFPTDPPGNGWGFNLGLAEAWDFQSLALPGPELVSAAWLTEGPGCPGVESTMRGVGTTPTTDVSFAVWDSFVTSVTVTQVPEPSSKAMLSTGTLVLVGLNVRRARLSRRRRNQLIPSSMSDETT